MSSNAIDLQIQSSFSDGKYSPRDLVLMAKEKGLQVIAITDHDTVGGVQEALLAGGEVGLRVIPGIEISAEEHDVHILGYGIDYKNERLLAELGKAHEGRISGAKKMAENLSGAGLVCEWDDVMKEATGDVVARPHLARAVLNREENKEKLGGISSVHDFIEKYLSNDSPLFVRRAHISAKDAIGLIHGAGGVAIWSHPAIHFRNDPDGLEKFLVELISWGIDGVEIFNPSHTEDDMEFLEGLAAKHHLLRTAGSDFHAAGQHTPDATGLHSANFPGDYETHGFSTEDIIQKLDEAFAKTRTIISKNKN